MVPARRSRSLGESNINIQDIVDFRTMFGLAPNFTANNVILNGPDPGINGSESEADVDVEWSGAAAPGATINFVVSAPTETTSGIDLSALYIIDNNFAGVMSESFGACEKISGPPEINSTIRCGNKRPPKVLPSFCPLVMLVPRAVTILTPSRRPATVLRVSGFASTPFDVAVSGTDFDQAGKQSQFWNTTPTTTTPPVPASALKYIPEVPWNDSCAQLALTGCGVGVNANLLNIVAGSGGASSIYPKPTWQMGVSGVPADSHRDLLTGRCTVRRQRFKR